jgi:hypothetical protein
VIQELFAVFDFLLFYIGCILCWDEMNNSRILFDNFWEWEISFAQLTSNILSSALTYILLIPNEAPNDANPITTARRTKTGPNRNIISASGGWKRRKCSSCIFFVNSGVWWVSQIIMIFFFWCMRACVCMNEWSVRGDARSLFPSLSLYAV